MGIRRSSLGRSGTDAPSSPSVRSRTGLETGRGTVVAEAADRTHERLAAEKVRLGRAGRVRGACQPPGEGQGDQGQANGTHACCFPCALLGRASW